VQGWGKLEFVGAAGQDWNRLLTVTIGADAVSNMRSGEMSMKQHQREAAYRHGGKGFKLAVFWISIAAFCSLVKIGMVHGEGFSLQVSKRPLESVLHDLSQKSGVRFVFDDVWADLPITVQFKNMALEPALKRILSNLNHAIIYNTDGSVTIRIYDVVTYEKGSVPDFEDVRSLSEEGAVYRPDAAVSPEDAGAATVDDVERPEGSEENLEGAEQESETAEEMSESEEAPEAGLEKDAPDEEQPASNEIEDDDQDQSPAADENKGEDG